MKKKAKKESAPGDTILTEDDAIAALSIKNLSDDEVSKEIKDPLSKKPKHKK